MSTRTIRPTSQKRPKAAAPLDNAQRAVRRILASQQQPESVQTMEVSGPIPATQGTGVERPVPEWIELNQSLTRTFAFVDICGFTKYTEELGARAATELLARFRSACRDVTTRRGARVAKWLGDGVMLVGTDPGAVIATVAELLLRFDEDEFDIHAGVAEGTVLLFEGDDYIGRTVNLAARLCEAAAAGEMLAEGVDDHIPEWVTVAGKVTVRAAGMGNVSQVSQLRVGGDAWAELPPVLRHPSMAGPPTSE